MHAFGLSDLGQYLNESNDNTAVIIQIETLAGYDNVEAIANVKGVGLTPEKKFVFLMVDVIFIGPFDLSNALGHPLAHGVEHPVVAEAIQKILDTAHKAGKKAGIYTTSYEDARKRVEQGFDMVHIGTDVALLAGGVGAAVAAAQGKAGGPAKGGY